VSVRVFGIRHHGPGSARALREALVSWRPDAVLVEGPPEAEAVLALAASPQMRPPVALLTYLVSEPRRAAFYPMAAWSPEWVAIEHALAAGAVLRMIDLPAAHALARDPAEAAAAEEKVTADTEEEGGEEAPAEAAAAEAAAAEKVEEEAEEAPAEAGSDLRTDPLGALARVAGYDDAERWWDDLIEHRPGHVSGSEGPWEALSEAIAALRASEPQPILRERRREAAMRQAIRLAERQGLQRVAVVCGAWHAPALAERGPARPDAELLAGLCKEKVAVTWSPWTYRRLARASGYGAGVGSPGWYEHLYVAPDRPIERWLVRVASTLREEGLPASPASVVAAVRLTEALAAMRGRPLAGLSECDDAARAVFAGGSDLPLSVIHDRLVVGLDLGDVPPETPMVPLASDLAGEQRRLRLKPEVAERRLDLDLRKATDLGRSHLLHRLRLLGVGWGEPGDQGGQSGTFHEWWALSWSPEIAVQVVEASVWGVTVEAAAGARAIELAPQAGDLAELTSLVEGCLLAELPAAVRNVMTLLDERAAHSNDTAELLAALPPLARALRYGTVRRTDADALSHVVGALVGRVSIGVVPACASLDDEAAAAMTERISQATAALAALGDDGWRETWYQGLRRLFELRGLHGLVAGRSCRILLDAGRLDHEDAARRLSVALSPTADPAQGAAWVEGLLGISALLLVHDRSLLELIDDWVCGVSAGVFEEVLPLLRRTFSLFERAEQLMLGDAVRNLDRLGPTPTGEEPDLDVERAAAVLPRVLQLLGVKVPAEPSAETVR
jgi:hypothetical protein